MGFGGINDLTATANDGATKLEQSHIVLRAAFRAGDCHERQWLSDKRGVCPDFLG